MLTEHIFYDYRDNIKSNAKNRRNNMRKFEIGKRYRDGAMTFEITGRTAKTVRFVMIQHTGRFNERKGDEKRAKVNNWDGREVFFTNCYQVEA